MTVWLKRAGERGNRKRVQRLMRLMGLEAIDAKPRLRQGNPRNRVYPHRLRAVPIERPDQVWSADITYALIPKGFLYLAATMDWSSRLVIAWRRSNSREGSFCQEMLEEALSHGRPEIFNTDQGVRFTAQAWTSRVEQAGAKVSMEGRGRCLDNVFVERLGRSVKDEHVYLHGYETASALRAGLQEYFAFYNEGRLHPSLG
jgi:putative transposase